MFIHTLWVIPEKKTLVPAFVAAALLPTYPISSKQGTDRIQNNGQIGMERSDDTSIFKEFMS